MKFCSKCDNYLYNKIDNDNENHLAYYCRACGYTDTTYSNEGVCVLKTQLRKGEQKFSHIVNRYTKLDPANPRIYNMKCPSSQCRTNVENKNECPEIIYVRYDDNNMKYLYICDTCNHVWKTDDNK